MEPAPHSTLEGYPVVIALPVIWGDQDAFGHVNNTVYLRWFESGRVDYFGRIGLSDLMRRSKIGPILASITCHYRREVNFPDQVQIGTRVSRIGKTSLTLEHAIVSESSKMVVAEGTSTVVVFDYHAHQPHPVPAPIRREIELLEGKTF